MRADSTAIPTNEVPMMRCDRGSSPVIAPVIFKSDVMVPRAEIVPKANVIGAFVRFVFLSEKSLP